MSTLEHQQPPRRQEMSTATTESLFHITEDLAALDALLTDSLGELTPEIEAWMAEYSTKLSEKVDGVGWYWRNLEAKSKVFADTSKEFYAKQKVEENKLAWLKEYVMQCMAALGQPKVAGSLYTLAVQKNGGSLPLTLTSENPADFPEECRVVTVSLDKKKVQAMAEAGELPALATVGERGNHVRLR